MFNPTSETSPPLSSTGPGIAVEAVTGPLEGVAGLFGTSLAAALEATGLAVACRLLAAARLVVATFDPEGCRHVVAFGWPDRYSASGPCRASQAASSPVRASRQGAVTDQVRARFNVMSRSDCLVTHSLPD